MNDAQAVGCSAAPVVAAIHQGRLQSSANRIECDAGARDPCPDYEDVKLGVGES
jgi:hypothetical protein